MNSINNPSLGSPESSTLKAFNMEALSAEFIGTNIVPLVQSWEGISEVESVSAKEVGNDRLLIYVDVKIDSEDPNLPNLKIELELTNKNGVAAIEDRTDTQENQEFIAAMEGIGPNLNSLATILKPLVNMDYETGGALEMEVSSEDDPNKIYGINFEISDYFANTLSGKWIEKARNDIVAVLSALTEDQRKALARNINGIRLDIPDRDKQFGFNDISKILSINVSPDNQKLLTDYLQKYKEYFFR